jgi:hypothetical protein
MRHLISDERSEFFEVKRFALGAGMTMTAYLLHWLVLA